MQPCRKRCTGWRSRCRIPRQRRRYATTFAQECCRNPCSLCEAANVVRNMAGQKGVPADRSQNDSEPFARAVIRGIARVLPEMPVNGQQAEADRDDVLLDIKGSLRFPQLLLFHQDAYVKTISGVNP